MWFQGFPMVRGTGLESMDFCSTPVRFSFSDPHRGFCFLRLEGFLLDSNYAKILFEKQLIAKVKVTFWG